MRTADGTQDAQTNCCVTAGVLLLCVRQDMVFRTIILVCIYLRSDTGKRFSGTGMAAQGAVVTISGGVQEW